MLPRKRTCIVATLAALLAGTAFAGTGDIEQRKENIVRVSLQKQGRETVDAALLESARKAAAIVTLSLSEAPGDPTLQIHTDGHPKYDWFFMDGGKKLVIDFHNTVNFESGKVLTPQKDGIIYKVRTSLFALEPEFVSRIVVDMNNKAVPVFNEVEKGLELLLTPTDNSVAQQAPVTTLAMQVFSELTRQRQSIAVDKTNLEDAATRALSETPAVALGPSPEADSPDQKALRSFLAKEEAAGKDFWAKIDAAIDASSKRIDAMEGRVRDVQTSIAKGSVDDAAATSALKSLLDETQAAGEEDDAKFRAFEADLKQAQQRSREEFTKLAKHVSVDKGQAGDAADVSRNGAKAGTPESKQLAKATLSPTPPAAPAFSRQTINDLLESLSKDVARLQAKDDAPKAEAGEVVTEGNIDLGKTEKAPAEQIDLNNQMALLKDPIAPLFNDTAPLTPVSADPATGLQLVTSVPLDLTAHHVSAHEDAASTENPAPSKSTGAKDMKALFDSLSPTGKAPAAADPAGAEAAPAPVAEKQAEPVDTKKETASTNSAAAEKAAPAPAEPAKESAAPAEQGAKPAAEEKPMVEMKPESAPAAAAPAPKANKPVAVTTASETKSEPDVAREPLPPGVDPLDQPVNIDFREMDLSAVVNLLAKRAQVNVIAGTDVVGTVTADIKNVPLRQAMDMVLRMNGLGIVEEEGVFRIVPYEEAVAARRTTRMVVLKNAQAEDVKTTLDGLLTGAADSKLITISANPATNVLIVAGPEKRVTEFETLARQLDVSEPALPTTTEAIKLNYIEPKDAKPIAETLITKETGKVEVDEQGRHLVVTDLPVVVEQIRNLLKDVDTPVKQVSIDAMIVDAVLRDASQTGVSWMLDAIRKYSTNGDLISDVSRAGFSSSNGIPFDAAGNPVTSAGLLPDALNAGALTLGILTNDIRLNTVIAAEAQSRNAQILANPSVVTVENKPATISIVQEFPYQEITQGLTGPPVSTTNFKDIGVNLEVTPRVTHTNDTIVNIKAKQSSVSGLTETGIPIEDLRQAETTLRAEDGRTIFIGGLRNVQDTHAVSKIPVLGDIPLLNVMFRNNNIEKINTELLIFLTCHVLGDKLPELTPAQQRENDKLDAVPPVPDSQRALFKDYLKPQQMRDPIWKWRRSNY